MNVASSYLRATQVLQQWNETLCTVRLWYASLMVTYSLRNWLTILCPGASLSAISKEYAESEPRLHSYLRNMLLNSSDYMCSNVAESTYPFLERTSLVAQWSLFKLVGGHAVRVDMLISLLPPFKIGLACAVWLGITTTTAVSCPTRCWYVLSNLALVRWQTSKHELLPAKGGSSRVKLVLWHICRSKH